MLYNGQMSIGIDLKRLRQDAHLSQPQVAKALNVTPQAVAHWEKHGSVGKNRLRQLARLYGVPISTLLPHDDLSPSSTEGFNHALASASQNRPDADVEGPRMDYMVMMKDIGQLWAKLERLQKDFDEHLESHEGQIRARPKSARR